MCVSRGSPDNSESPVDAEKSIISAINLPDDLAVAGGMVCLPASANSSGVGRSSIGMSSLCSWNECIKSSRLPVLKS